MFGSSGDDSFWVLDLRGDDVIAALLVLGSSNEQKKIRTKLLGHFITGRVGSGDRDAIVLS
jgi:hypothetical protein